MTIRFCKCGYLVGLAYGMSDAELRALPEGWNTHPGRLLPDAYRNHVWWFFESEDWLNVLLDEAAAWDEWLKKFKRREAEKRQRQRRLDELMRWAWRRETREPKRLEEAYRRKYFTWEKKQRQKEQAAEQFWRFSQWELNPGWEVQKPRDLHVGSA